MTLASTRTCDCALLNTNDGCKQGAVDVYFSSPVPSLRSTLVDNCDNAKLSCKRGLSVRLTNMIESNQKLTSPLIMLLLLIAVTVIEPP